MNTINMVMAGLFLLIVIYVGAKVMMKPVKLLWKVAINSVIGLVLLLLVNYGAAQFGFVLPVNIITILVAGFLGIPGILLLICFQLLLK